MSRADETLAMGSLRGAHAELTHTYAAAVGARVLPQLTRSLRGAYAAAVSAPCFVAELTLQLTRSLRKLTPYRIFSIFHGYIWLEIRS